MRIVAFIAGALVATASYAGMPPERYDRPYTGRLTEWRVPLGKAAGKCNGLARQLGHPMTHPDKIDGRPLYGCAYPLGKSCFIVWSFDPSGDDPQMADNVRRHEIGHCNGWGPDHPDSR